MMDITLGLNDSYSQHATSDTFKLSRNKKNNTIKWYNLLSQEEKEKITRIAVRNRIQVMKEYRRDERTIGEQQQNKMETGKVHQEALKVKK